MAIFYSRRKVPDIYSKILKAFLTGYCIEEDDSAYYFDFHSISLAVVGPGKACKQGHSICQPLHLMGLDIRQEGAERMIVTLSKKKKALMESVRTNIENCRALESINRNKGKKMANNNVVIQVITLTPERAAQLLQNKNANRSVRKTSVALLKQTIETGNWVLNGESIVLDERGHLIDGQHRCIAVIEAGRSIETILVSGINYSDAFPTIDQGQTRLFRDALAVDGVGFPSDIAAAVRLLFICDLVVDNSRFSLRSSAIRRLAYERKFDNLMGLNMYKTKYKDVDLFIDVARLSRGLLLPKSVALAALCFIYQRNTAMMDSVLDFGLKLFLGEELSSGHVLLSVRRQLINRGMAKKSASNPAVKIHCVADIVSAWNHLAWSHRFVSRVISTELRRPATLKQPLEI